MTAVADRRGVPRAYRVSERWVRSALGAVKGAFDGAWLGMLDGPHLDRLDAAFYDGRGEYVDDDYTSSGLHAWEQSAIDRHFPPGGRVVVTGAGGGREVLALLRAGFDAMGYECNPRLVQYGDRFLRARGHEDRLHLAPRHSWPAPDARWDGVVLGWGSYTHITGRAQRIALLRAARTQVPHGAPLLLSFWTTASITTYLKTVYVVGRGVRRLRMRPPVELGDALVGTYVHYFTQPQIRGELADGGFDLVSFSDRNVGVAVATASSSRQDP